MMPTNPVPDTRDGINPAGSSFVSSALICLVALVVTLSATAAGGSNAPVRFSHAVNPALPDRPLRPVSNAGVPETLNVLVAMVQFPLDTDPRTSGNGHFDITSPPQQVIDPTPHDIAYVRSHMTFVENYFAKVSGGRLIVQVTVLDSVYSVPKFMSAYSPPRSSTDNIELGHLMQDAWHVVDSVSPSVQFQNYSAFGLLHAGVGRDVDLASTLGYDPTPFDIPSVYVTLAALKKMFGADYAGIPVRGGAFTIQNSMILPETESRVINTGLGNALLQLGVNGLIAASIGSNLGLPDLFDTKTGASGIGRFGLMDGESIFSWDGVFPPEPSAWEKYFLGWVQPITVPPGSNVYDLPAAALNPGADSIYRIPISAKEYFLVENRSRDAHLDGSTVTIMRNGGIVQKTFLRDTTSFNSFNQDSIWGNVENVDEFDWSLPGGINPNNGALLTGGILIWHIDETVIDAEYAADAVNANPDRRGVNLMEADGSQDIGQSYGLISPGGGSENGTALDFWYAGNFAPLRTTSNEFTPSSHPSSISNDHADSHIYVKEFSASLPRMTARIQLGDASVTPIAGFPKNIFRGVQRNALSVTLPRSGPSRLSVATYSAITPGFPPQQGSLLFGWNADGSALAPLRTDGLLATTPAQLLGAPLLRSDSTGALSSLTLPVQAVGQASVVSWSIQDANHDSLADEIFNLPIFAPPETGNFTTSLTRDDSLMAVGTADGTVWFVSETGRNLGPDTQTGRDTVPTVGVSLLDALGDYIMVRADGLVGIVHPPPPPVLPPAIEENFKQFSRPMSSPAVAGTISPAMGKRIALASRNGFVYLLDTGLNAVAGFPVFTNGEILNAPALADVDGDGQKDIVVFSGNRIYAINAAGAIVDNFPITVPSSQTILSSPVVADLDGDGKPDVVAVTQEGLVVAYDRSGNMLKGFPVLAGANGGSTPAAFYVADSCSGCSGVGLACASDDGHVYAWKIGLVEGGSRPNLASAWPEYLHDEAHTGLNETPLTQPAPPPFFPGSRVYNWPNPVRSADGFLTHIRYYVAANAKVTVRIFDLAGGLVGELHADGRGGFDNDIPWDVSQIQSGVYFAHVDAEGSGESGSAIIKIAVVK